MLSRLFIVAGLSLIVTVQFASTSTARSRHGIFSVHGGSTHLGCGAHACDGSVRPAGSNRFQKAPRRFGDGSVRSTGSNRFQKGIGSFGDGSVRPGCSSHACDGSVRVLDRRMRR